MLPNADFWRGKRVLLTGHTGFKGGWLALWLRRLGANVSGLSLDPPPGPTLFASAGIASLCEDIRCDIRDAAPVASAVCRVQPELVFHLAAQALVRPSYREPLETFATNVLGTAHVLDALRSVESARVAVMVTTDKVYRNREWAYPYREDDALGGHDPYSASKAASEIVIASYRSAFLQARGTAVASVRAGNVIGGGDWSEDRLIPDAIRAWQSGTVLKIRAAGATRPWQHVLEPLAAYLHLAERLWADPNHAGPYNIGPNTADAATVGQVVDLARRSYGTGVWTDISDANAPHEAGSLALEVAHARARLGIAPRWRLEDAVQRTMLWYRHHAEGEDARALCDRDIDAYEDAA